MGGKTQDNRSCSSFTALHTRSVDSDANRQSAMCSRDNNILLVVMSFVDLLLDDGLFQHVFNRSRQRAVYRSCNFAF